MKNLYLIEYGCSICLEHLVVLAKDQGEAIEFAYQEAQNVYYSYDCNYPDEGMDNDDIAELAQQEMELDIHYCAEPFDPENEEHNEVLKEQNNKPFEI